MAQEYWKWPETVWVSQETDWRKAERLTAGVDIGTTSSQAAVLCDGKLFGYANIRTGVDFRKAAVTAMDKALGGSGIAVKDLGAVIGTGFGSDNIPFATGIEDEVHCHAKGARFMFGPEVRTVVDLGGQTTKAILLYDWDRVRDFMINDKCATGMGRNIEYLCGLLQAPIEEIGALSLEVNEDPEPVSTTCYAFADTETMGLFGRPEYRADKMTDNEVYASHVFAVAWRVLGLIGRLAPLDVGDVKVCKELGFTGGLAKNVGVTKRIERELGVTALDSEYDPQIAGAIGAALLAR
ncbi:MAG: acyl-CoA dehydratase activase [Peptococcaceae bacterium]|jgi:predicted CoA-substrate-specific enzyme activase|nr:acyl-CoA dehydratase activase [Peptococcaceae bacterium]